MSALRSSPRTRQSQQAASLFALTLQIPLDLLDHMVQEAEQLAQQCRPIAEPSLVFGPTQIEQLFRSLGKWAAVTQRNEDYVISQIQGGLLLFTVGGA